MARLEPGLEPGLEPAEEPLPVDDRPPDAGSREQLTRAGVGDLDRELDVSLPHRFDGRGRPNFVACRRRGEMVDLDVDADARAPGRQAGGDRCNRRLFGECDESGRSEDRHVTRSESRREVDLADRHHGFTRDTRLERRLR